MNLTAFFALLGGLLVLAFVANRLSRRTGIPDVIVLMCTGILLGPVLHWVNAGQFEGITRGFGALALILILFEAGLELDLSDSARHLLGGLVLALLSFVLSALGTAYFVIAAMHLPRLPAFLVGSVVGCISSSIVLPVLQQIPVSLPVKTTLVVEASLSDALGVLAVGILLELFPGASTGSSGWVTRWLLHLTPGGASGSLLGGAAASIVVKALISLLLAVGAGFLWARLLPVLSEQRFWQVLTFGAVLLVYSGSHFAGGIDLFAVIVFGATLANLGRKKGGLSLGDISAESSTKGAHQDILAFHSELAFLVRTFFFVLLGVIVAFEGLRSYALLAFGILGVLFLARWTSVQASRLVWRGIGPREHELMVWMIPRGLITAVLALEVVDARGEEFHFLLPVAFALILLTNVILLGGTIRARSLGSSAAKEASPVSGISTPPEE